MRATDDRKNSSVWHNDEAIELSDDNASVFITVEAPHAPLYRIDIKP